MCFNFKKYPKSFGGLGFFYYLCIVNQKEKIMKNSYKVSFSIDCIMANSPLEAATEISSILLEVANEMVFDVTNEQNNKSVSVDLSEPDEIAVLPNNEVKTINAYQLHDSETEEILGAVFVDKSNENTSDEIFEGWESFNKLEEYEGNTKDINEFIVWFNENYVTQIGLVNMDFIQPGNY